ncbi:MAG TPA: FHA domain-containing protein [Gemmatimonadaceae bacterium]|nr:FHA domain-containing protein [Gemmatimonadaceae bacterium]
MHPCAFCGRANEQDSRFCIDCGKPTGAPAARGGRAGDHDPLLCAECGHRVAPEPIATCPACGAAISLVADRYCARCGIALGASPLPRGAPAGVVRDSQTAALPAGRRAGPKLSLLDDHGAVAQSYSLDGGEATVGRCEGAIRFPDDVYLSPLHAHLAWREERLWLRDLGSRNGSWLFLDGPLRLADHDVLLIGSQLVRFRRVGYPAPHPPEADQTRRMGSLTPGVDSAVLQQLRGDGSVRDAMHLSPGRSVVIGRDIGDWTFPYDPTMSARHAEVRSEDNEFVVRDAGSRNGIALAVHGERAVTVGQRILLGDQILRVERA